MSVIPHILLSHVEDDVKVFIIVFVSNSTSHSIIFLFHSPSLPSFDVTPVCAVAIVCVRIALCMASFL